MLELILSTLSRPRETIRDIIARPVSKTDIMKVAALLSCFSGILGYALSFYMNRANPGQFAEPGSPLMGAAVNFALVYVFAFLIDRVGSFLGGQGTFDGALKVSVWSSIVGLLAIAAAIIVMVLADQLGFLALVVFSAWSFVLLAVFIQELHGFRSLAATIGGVFATTLILMFLFSVLAAMLGFVDAGAPQNV